jgi:HemY protein
LKGLAALQPEHRESKLLLAELALEAQDAATARSLLAPLLASGAPSARLGAFAARLARLEDKDEEARRWMTRAVHAPAEADWSDIDPEGGAFAFDDSDWRRMVYVYGDEGALIHPRYERYESAAEAVPETALLERPRRAKAPAAASEGGPRAFDPSAHQPDDPGVSPASRDDEGAAA